MWYDPLRVEVFCGLAKGLALIFDLDGVIVDSNPVHQQVWRLYMKQFGVMLDDEMLARMYGRRNDDILPDFFGKPLTREETIAHGAAKEALYRQVMKHRLAQHLVPGVRSFLERHRAAEAPIGLATNAEPENAEYVLQESGLRDFFQVVVDGRQVDRPKPDPQIYLIAAQLLETAPGNCIVFEDSAPGVEAARAAGARIVGITTTHTALPGAGLNIDNFLSLELEEWLRRQRPID